MHEVKFCVDYTTDSPVKADAWFVPEKAEEHLWVWDPVNWINSGLPISEDIPPDESYTNPLYVHEQIDKFCPEDPVIQATAGPCPDDGLQYYLSCRTSGNCQCGERWSWLYETNAYCFGNVNKYSHLTLLDNKLVSPTLTSTNDDTGYMSMGLFPILDFGPAIEHGGDEAILVESLSHYTPMEPQEWTDDTTWSSLHNVTCDGGPSWFKWYWPRVDSIQKEKIHWLSNTLTLQQGYFALNKVNACNGRVDIVSDDQSYFLSGTYLYNATSWVGSSTGDVTGEPTHVEKYIALRDGGVRYLEIDDIGNVSNSAVLSTSTEEGNPFTVDNDEFDLSNSKLTGIAGITLDAPMSKEEECWYNEVSGVITETSLMSKADYTYSGDLKKSCLTLKKDFTPYSVIMDNSNIEIADTSILTEVENLDFGGSDTILDIDGVTTLNLVNYTATNLAVKASGSSFSGKLDFYLGFDLLFDQLDLNITIDLGTIEAGKQHINYRVAMLNCTFTTIPTEIILTGLSLSDYTVKNEDGWHKAEAIKYLLENVEFVNGGDNQTWDGTVVTYTLGLGDFSKKELKFYGIPTGTMLSTRVKVDGIKQLKDRVDNEHTYAETLFGPRDAFLEEIDNKAKSLYYDTAETIIDDLELPRCDKNE